MRVEVVDQERTRELRRSVLRPELTAGDPLPGDELSGGVHLAAVDEAGSVLCTCFVYPDPPPWLSGRGEVVPDAGEAWHLRQMATDPAHRGQGVGGEVLEAAIAHVRAAGARLLWCNARVRAAGFYSRHGFAVHGAQYVDERGEPHLRMWRELSGEPTPSEG
jgi:GNAT superfamily N-acetyltransferase